MLLLFAIHLDSILLWLHCFSSVLARSKAYQLAEFHDKVCWKLCVVPPFQGHYRYCRALEQVGWDRTALKALQAALKISTSAVHLEAIQRRIQKRMIGSFKLDLCNLFYYIAYFSTHKHQISLWLEYLRSEEIFYQYLLLYGFMVCRSLLCQSIHINVALYINIIY